MVNWKICMQQMLWLIMIVSVLKITKIDGRRLAHLGISTCHVLWRHRAWQVDLWRYRAWQVDLWRHRAWQVEIPKCANLRPSFLVILKTPWYWSWSAHTSSWWWHFGDFGGIVFLQWSYQREAWQKEPRFLTKMNVTIEMYMKLCTK